MPDEPDLLSLAYRLRQETGRLPRELCCFLRTPWLFARVGEPVGDVRAVPHICNGKPFPQDLFATTRVPTVRAREW